MHQGVDLTESLFVTYWANEIYTFVWGEDEEVNGPIEDSHHGIFRNSQFVGAITVVYMLTFVQDSFLPKF